MRCLMFVVIALCLASCEQPPAEESVDDLAMRLQGRYAVRGNVANVQEVPLLGKMSSTSVILGLAEIRKEGEALVMSESGCRVTVQGNAAAATLIPDVVPRSLGVRKATLTIQRQGEALTWSRPEITTPVGVKLADPEKDILPVKADDPRIFDQDMDGKPGITVSVSGLVMGDIYLVQKLRTRYEGSVGMDGNLSGLLADRSEQQVIGASNPLLNQNVQITPDPDAQKSTFKLVRLQAEYDCDKLIADEKKLFP